MKLNYSKISIFNHIAIQQLCFTNVYTINNMLYIRFQINILDCMLSVFSYKYKKNKPTAIRVNSKPLYLAYLDILFK